MKTLLYIPYITPVYTIYPIVLTPREVVQVEPWSEVDLDGQYLWTWCPPALEVAAAAEAHPGSKYQLGLQAGTFSVDLHIGVGQHEAYVRYSWFHSSLSLSKLHFFVLLRPIIVLASWPSFVPGVVPCNGCGSRPGAF